VPSVRELTDRAAVALDALARTGQAIDDEWQYVNDLESVWRARLTEVAAARGDEAVAAEVEAAVDAAVAESGAIDDPHRAIDWISTFPQVVLLALGEPT
jgi:hypothetical protein